MTIHAKTTFKQSNPSRRIAYHQIAQNLFDDRRRQAFNRKSTYQKNKAKMNRIHTIALQCAYHSNLDSDVLSGAVALTKMKLMYPHSV